MSIKISCTHCGRRLKLYSEQAGKKCKCPRCGQAFEAPATIPSAAANGSPSRRWGKLDRRVLRAGTAIAVVTVGILLVVLIYLRMHSVGPRLTALSGDDPAARSEAVLWLAQADPQDSARARVTAALEPIVFEGDVRGSLDPDLVLRAYLHWANQDNVPSMIRMVENPSLPSWRPEKTGWVMETLGKLQDNRAADALARKLSDPQLHDQAVDALKLMGPGAEGSVVEYLFAGDAATRQRAADLLADYGTDPAAVLDEARARLKSNDPEEQRAAAEWFAENPPQSDAEKGRSAGALAGLLGDLSPEVNGVALRALKLWATKDCLPELVDYAHRLEKAGNTKQVAANKSALIDVLVQFPDEAAADAIGLQLKDPAQREKASQALLVLGPIASDTVSHYINHPDEGVRKEAQRLSRELKVASDHQLDQILGDIDDARKARSRTALEHLARLRVDETSRAMVSKALNAPLADPDAGIRDAALDAVRVWGTQENTTALVNLLGTVPPERKEHDARTSDKVVQALISLGSGAEDAVAPLLRSPDGLVRRQACFILSKIGTEKSVAPLDAAASAYVTVDRDFYLQTQDAIAKVRARK
jgi:hypothetical protein